MALEGISNERTEKVYVTMKTNGILSEEKSVNVERITQLAKPLPKNIVSQALTELADRGYAKKVTKEKASRYYLLK